jgi:hypothetical protein
MHCCISSRNCRRHLLSSHIQDRDQGIDLIRHAIDVATLLDKDTVETLLRHAADTHSRQRSR